MTDFSSEIVNLKEALEAAERANHRKNDFLNRMSHEIRTPLNAIIGLSYLSMENDALPPKVYENLDKIEQSAHFLLSVVNDILSLSDLETGKIALEWDSIENEVFFAELKERIGQLTAEKQIHFTFSVLNEMDKYYVYDSKKLKKTLMYVVESAVKSTPAGGSIVIETEILSQNAENAVLRFTVSDNGAGIDEELLPVVFEPFEHIYGGSRTLYDGSGLELAIAKLIVELMNGQILVQSKKGEGTAFTIDVTVKIERRKKQRPKEEGTKKTVYDFTGKRALIVEDSEINIEIARNILVHKNFEAEVALNGEEALRAFKSHEPGYYDVILMDIRMPVMDGLEASKAIRTMTERPDGKCIPIVAMTANAFEEDVRKSFEAGMNGHLSKPIDVKQMYAMLDMLLYEE